MSEPVQRPSENQPHDPTRRLPAAHTTRSNRDAGWIAASRDNLRGWLGGLTSFWQDDDAATAVEYAVMLALILVAILGSVTALSNATRDSFNNTASAISTAFN